jgi:hypothetical protein
LILEIDLAGSIFCDHYVILVSVKKLISCLYVPIFWIELAGLVWMNRPAVQWCRWYTREKQNRRHQEKAKQERGKEASRQGVSLTASRVGGGVSPTCPEQKASFFILTLIGVCVLACNSHFLFLNFLQLLKSFIFYNLWSFDDDTASH